MDVRAYVYTFLFLCFFGGSFHHLFHALLFDAPANISILLRSWGGLFLLCFLSFWG